MSKLSQKGFRGNSFQCSFVDGAFVKINGQLRQSYLVQFIDSDNNELVHQGVIKNNEWIRTARSYFTKWKVKILRKSDGVQVFSHLYECNNQRVYIAIESAALGDTLAWFDSVDRFRKKYKCKLICSTFMNNLFQDKYPEIEFIDPGKKVNNLYAMYRIGWYYDQNNQVDYNYHLRDFREHPLVESACDILGLSYVQNRPRILNVNVHRPIEKEYVCIAIHATTQAKYWNNPQGWSDVVKFLKEKGYEVILLSKEGLYFMGNNAPEMVKHIPEGPITNIINYLQHAKLFIGVGSGLTWLSWAVGCQTCLISGFSYPYTEFDECTRIYSDDLEVCSGCFNRYKLDMEDWNWCPDQKNTPRMFECTKSITSQKVILAIKDLL